MRVVPVKLAANSYDIFIGKDVAGKIIEMCSSMGFSKKALIISDSNVAPLYGTWLKQLLAEAQLEAEIYVIEAGEASKSMQVAEAIYTRCIEQGLDRKSPVFALGGGVVGDLAGFIAATYMRGVPFIQVPTSLLAQVDSSVGGKVAVNHKLGKNLIGAFYQAKAVFMDLNTMETLPEREIYTGLGEIIKYERRENSLTKEKLYVLTVECNHLEFDVCINEEDLMGEPEVGRRFKASIWLQGRLNFEEAEI